MPSYTIRATDKETGEVRLMKVQAGTPMTEVIKAVRRVVGIDEAECRFLVGGRPLKTDKPLDRQVALTATQPPPSAVIDDGDERRLARAVGMPAMGQAGLLKKAAVCGRCCGRPYQVVQGGCPSPARENPFSGIDFLRAAFCSN